MHLFICHLCNYSTKRNNDFIKHQETNKHKKNKEKYDLEQEKVAKVAEKGLKRTEKGLKSSQKGLEKDSKGLEKDSELENQKYECEYCGILLKTRPIYLRHIRKFCKIKKKKEVEELDNSDSLLSRLKKLEKEKEKLHRHIEKLIEKTGDNISIEHNQNIDHNIEHNQNIENNEVRNLKQVNQVNQLNQLNQINLNSFGNEDISHISDKFMQKLLSIPYVGIQKLIEKVHFSKKKPENKNIALTNKKEKLIKIFANNKWKYKNRDEIIDEMINTNYTRLDDFYEEKGKENLKETHNKNYESFQKKFEENDKDLHSKIKSESEMILLSDNL